jgi:cobalt-zinc-cadmium efflux system membrane fusion protein
MKTAVIPIIILLLLASCRGTALRESAAPADEEAAVPEITDVSLTESQVKSLDLNIGPLPNHVFSGEVPVNGRLVCPPQSRAAVTAYQGAVVRRIVVVEGQNVRRGQPLAYLSHPDLLDLQNRYQTAAYRLRFVAQEYARQKKLYEQKVGAGKDFEQTQSEYLSLTSEVRNYISQMRLLGIDVKAVSAGKTVTEVPVVSPISGSVEKINVETGGYADPQNPMFSIMNTSRMYADLFVYEKDIPKLHPGRRVTLRLQARPGVWLHGTVSSVGKSFDEETKTVCARVRLSGHTPGLIEGMYVSGSLSSQQELSSAIAEDGVVDEQGRSYIFTGRKTPRGWTFSPVEVQKGRTEDGFVEIRTAQPLPQGARVALNGAYYLMSEMKKAETGEDD